MNITHESLTKATDEELIFGAKKMIEALEQRFLTQIQFKIAESARSSIVALELMMLG